MKDNKVVAVKISKNTSFDVSNAQVEAKLLKKIKAYMPEKGHGLILLIDSFKFRGHFVIVCEFLHQNLYKHIIHPDFKGLKNKQLRSIASQLLKGLQVMKQIGIIHCDLKPENLMFADEKCETIKIIDFGTACTEFKTGFTYVQSRFYRCPEILLGVPYEAAADMWSIGCILCELVTTRPIFPAHDELELLEMLI